MKLPSQVPMYKLDQMSITARLYGDKLEPTAIVIMGLCDRQVNAPQFNLPERRLIYLCVEGKTLSGQGFTNLGEGWEAMQAYHNERFGDQFTDVTMDGLSPRLRGVFIMHCNEYLQSHDGESVGGISRTVALFNQEQKDEESLRAGVCRTPSQFALHVKTLAKNLDDFEYQEPHLQEMEPLFNAIAFLGGGLDLLKKAAIYGDPKKMDAFDAFCRTRMPTRQEMAPVSQLTLAHLKEDVSLRNLLHHLLGIVGEAAEIAEVACEFLRTGKVAVDGKGGLKEELGDLRFYISGALAAMGSTEELNNQQNFDKLKVRYPAGYTDEKALNRDLEAEHQALSKE